MNLNIQVDIKGGDEYLGYAKKKLYALLDFMKSVKVPFFTQKIYVSDGTTIDLYANFYGFQRIRIRGGVPFPILLFDFVENKWIAFDVTINKGTIGIKIIDYIVTLKDFGSSYESPILAIDRTNKELGFNVYPTSRVSFFFDGSIKNYGILGTNVFVEEGIGAYISVYLGVGTDIVYRPSSIGGTGYSLNRNTFNTRLECSGRNNFSIDNDNNLEYENLQVRRYKLKFLPSHPDGQIYRRDLTDDKKIIKPLPEDKEDLWFNHIAIVGQDTIHTKRAINITESGSLLSKNNKDRYIEGDVLLAYTVSAPWEATVWQREISYVKGTPRCSPRIVPDSFRDVHGTDRTSAILYEGYRYGDLQRERNDTLSFSIGENQILSGNKSITEDTYVADIARDIKYGGTDDPEDIPLGLCEDTSGKRFGTPTVSPTQFQNSTERFEQFKLSDPRYGNMPIQSQSIINENGIFDYNLLDYDCNHIGNKIFAIIKQTDINHYEKDTALFYGIGETISGDASEGIVRCYTMGGTDLLRYLKIDYEYTNNYFIYIKNKENDTLIKLDLESKHNFNLLQDLINASYQEELSKEVDGYIVDVYHKTTIKETSIGNKIKNVSCNIKDKIAAYTYEVFEFNDIISKWEYAYRILGFVALEAYNGLAFGDYREIKIEKTLNDDNEDIFLFTNVIGGNEILRHYPSKYEYENKAGIAVM